MMAMVVPKILRMGSINIQLKAMIGIADTMAAKKACPRTENASSRFPAPTAIDMSVAAPTLRGAPMPSATSIIGKPAITAARASVPMPWPIKIRSMKLQRPFTSMIAMEGSENFRDRPSCPSSLALRPCHGYPSVSSRLSPWMPRAARDAAYAKRDARSQIS
jgi:hypothetical protein